MTERVLLTGISGYIGQHCGAELLRHGYEVVGTVRSSSKADATRAARIWFAEGLILSSQGLFIDEKGNPGWRY